MRKIIFFSSLLFLFYSCNLQGVKKTTDSASDTLVETIINDAAPNDTLVKKTEEKPSDTLTLENGVRIIYYKHGKGKEIKKGDLVKVRYRSKLPDGTVFDGNHKVKQSFIPFMVGWSQLTKGWDIALQQMKIGDDVDIFIPSQFARGEKGIPGIIPPNTDITISMHVIGELHPIDSVKGIKVWKYDEFKEKETLIEMGDAVYINYWASSESRPRYDNSYKNRHPFRLLMEKGNAIPGLIKALLYGRRGDRLMIKIDSKLAYGNKGLQQFVKPNEDIFYDIQIAQVIKKENLPQNASSEMPK